MKTVVSVVGIRPDFIRMHEVFKKLDEKFLHIIIHSGQHYEKMLSDVFFDELEIRKPDYNLGIGGPGLEHFHQTATLEVKIIELFRQENIKPDIVLFLGDSNSVCCAVPLAKEGYRIGHIEAGMRSYDRRMLEEINRVVCDHLSDFLFVYHNDYKQQAMAEGIPEEKIFVVGNTVVEPCLAIAKDIFKQPKRKSHILLDIHRPENFKYKNRLENILAFARLCKETAGLPVKMLKFGRTMKALEDFHIKADDIDMVDLMSYINFLHTQYHALYIISDSGTAQEEPALLQTPVIVPRDYTERPQSVQSGCSFMLDVNTVDNFCLADSWIADKLYNPESRISTFWLGSGHTSETIAAILEKAL
jgi:UDP-N-acetylglucosamine 2-epimerase (non-hydrolysing)